LISAIPYRAIINQDTIPLMGHMMKIIYNVTDDEDSVSFIADPEQITLF